MTFSNTITVGDLFAGLMMVCSAIAFYFAGVRRVDAVVIKADVLEKSVEELRRGRGLILDGDSNWPDAVRRCFGYGRRER